VNPASANTLLSAPPCAVASRDLAHAAKADEARWFNEEIRPHESDLRAFLRARFPTLTDVDDLVQESYVRLVHAHAAGRPGLNRAYLFVVARNAGLDLVRRQRCVLFESLGNFDDSLVVEDRATNPAEIFSLEQEHAMLHDALRQLPPRCGEIMRLRRFEGLSYQQIAEKLGLSERTVNAQLALGIVRCRRYLAARGVSSARFHAAENPTTSA
jgi:RNA polymerase sigma factor (sigma-70 family)